MTEPGATEEASPAPRRRWTRVLRWVGLALVGLLALVAVALLFLLRTDPGLEFVRSVAVDVANDTLRGEVRVARLHGDALSTLHLEGLEVRTATGGQALTLDALTVRWRPSLLFAGQIAVERVALDAPRVRLVQTSSASWNLLDILPPPSAEPAPPDEGPLDLPAIRVDELILSDGAVTVRPTDAEPVALSAVALSASAEVDGDRVQVELRSLSARGVPMVEAASLRATASLDGDRAEVRDLRLGVGSGRIEVPELEARLPLGSLSGRVEIDAPRDLLVRLGAPPEWRPDATLDLRVGRAADAPRWSVSGRATLGDMPMTLAATATEDLEDLRVSLNAPTVDPRAILTFLPQADLQLDLTARGDLENPIRPEAEAQVRLRGRLRPPGRAWISVAPLAVEASLRGQRVVVKAEGRVGAARLDLDAAVREIASSPVVEDARVQIDAPDLGALLGDAAAGQVSLTATVAGPLDGLRAQGRLSARALAYGTWARARQIGARWSLDRVWPRPRGEASVRVDEALFDGRPIDQLRFRALAEGEDAATRVEVTTLALRTDGSLWRGGGAVARLYPGGRVDVRGLGLHGDAGQLRVEGTYRPLETSRLTFALVRLDLGALPRRLLPELGTYQGVVDLQAQASLSGRTVEADLALAANALALAPEEPGVDLTSELSLRRSALTLTATVGSDRLGRARLYSTSTPPRDMLSGEGWANLAKRPVERLRLTTEDLRLGRLQRVLGEDPLLTGGLSGMVTLDDGGGRARVDLRTKNLDVQSVARPILKVGARFDPGKARLDLQLDGPNVGRASVTATAAAPRNLFDVAGWTSLDEASIERADVDLRRLDLALLDRLDLVPGLRGRVDAEVDVYPEPVEGRRPLYVAAEVSASGVRVPALYRSLDAKLSLRVDDRQLRLTSGLRAEGTQLLEIAAQAPLPLRRLIHGDPADLPSTPLQLDAEVDALPLPLLAKIGGFPPNLVEGTLTASVTARGTAQDPLARARVTLDQLSLTGVDFDLATVTATLAEGDLQADLRMRGQDGGRLEASMSTPLAEPDLDGRLFARGFELRFLSGLGLLPLGLDADLFADVSVAGTPARLRPSGWIELRDLSIVFEQAVLHPLSEGKARVELSPQAVRADLNARAGEGKVSASADVTIPDEGPVGIEARADLDKYPVSAGTLVRVDLAADVRGKSGPDGTEIDVELHDGFVDVPDEGTESLHPISTPDDVVYVDRLPGGRRRVPSSTVAAGPPTRVSVRTREAISVRGGPVIARLATDVRAETTPAGALLGGRAYTTDGTIELFRRRYEIVKAQLTFTGQNPPDPRVEVRLRHQFPTLELTLQIAGTADEPELTFLGRPARYSQAELLTIFLGTDPKDLGQTSDASLEQQATGAIAGFFVGKLQNQIAGVLPIDTLDVELGPDAGVAGARVTLGKWITQKIFVAYRYRFNANPEQQNTNEAVIQYRFLPGWMAEAVLGLTRNDLDVFWTKRF